MNKPTIAKYRKDGRPGEWWLTDFTMEQVEQRISTLEAERDEALAKVASQVEEMNRIIRQKWNIENDREMISDRLTELGEQFTKLNLRASELLYKLDSLLVVGRELASRAVHQLLDNEQQCSICGAYGEADKPMSRHLKNCPVERWNLLDKTGGQDG